MCGPAACRRLRRAGNVGALGRASAADVDLPRADVELAVHVLDLPSGGAVVQVGGGEHVDALDGPLLETDGRNPSEGRLVAAENDLADGEADGWLGALAGDEGRERAEGVAAERDTGEPVDAVGGVGEVAGEEGVGGRVGVRGQEGGVAIDEVGSGCVGQAES